MIGIKSIKKPSLRQECNYQNSTMIEMEKVDANFSLYYARYVGDLNS